LQQEFTIAKEKEDAFNKCMLGPDALNAKQAPRVACSNEELLTFQMNHEETKTANIPIWHVPGDTAFFYEAGMTIDADGAPNAYHPDNIGLDDLSNAGSPGYWMGLAKNADGEPFVQGPNDPFPAITFPRPHWPIERRL